ECDVELNQDLAVGRHVQATDVDDAGALAAACATGERHVGAGRNGDKRERARREYRVCVEGVQVVEYPEIVERLIGRAKAQRIAQPVAGSGGVWGGVPRARAVRWGVLR